nr:retrovirus-related Pol polyprotein from transposon TNT 1-94 [Tanacetum cinerariifolium]
MATLSEDIQCAGSDTRPSMLDRTDFASWQQRIRLETLTEGIEGALHLGPEQPRVYSDITPEENDRMQLNSKFVNNMLPEWCRFVTAVKLNRGLRDSNYDQLYAYLKQREAHANENKMMLDRFTQHTVDLSP